jgi:hypothetical protein
MASWARAWIAFFVLLMCLCLAQRTGGAMVGGKSAINAEDARVKAAAKFAMDDAGAGNNAQWRVVSAQQQVVAGLLYHLKIEVNREGQDCEVSRSGMRFFGWAGCVWRVKIASSFRARCGWCARMLFS